MDTLPGIKLRNVNIKYKDKAKYLGVILDKRLTWKDHVKDLICRANKRIGILKYIRDQNETIKTGQLITLYKSLIRPVMEYAAEVWGDASPYLKTKLDSIQHQALTKALEVNRLAHRHQVNYEAKVLPLEYRRLEKYFKFYKKISNTEMGKNILLIKSNDRLKWNRRKSFVEKIQYLKNLFILKYQDFEVLSLDRFKKIIINNWIKELNEKDNLRIERYKITNLKYKAVDSRRKLNSIWHQTNLGVLPINQF